MSKRYNTPHRTRIIKTRVTEEEHADFMERLTAYGMSQSEFIRQAITGATVKPIITVSPINDELLAAVGRLTGEYGKIGGNLNQIARYLNEYGTPYNTLSTEVRAALSDLAALKFQVLREVGEAIVTKNPALLPQAKPEMAGFRNREAERLNCYQYFPHHSSKQYSSILLPTAVA